MKRSVLWLFPLAVLFAPVELLSPRQLLPPDPPGPIVRGPMGAVAAGDTLIYTVSWGAGARATTYDVVRSVAATDGGWSIVADSNPVGKFLGPLAFPNTSNVSSVWFKTWYSAVPWDSATFTVSVSSRNSAGVSAAVTATWRVLRKPAPPGPIIVDSSKVVTGLLVQPQPPNTVVFVGATRQFCAWPVFLNGAVAERSQDRAQCDTLYARTVTPAQAALVTAATQAKADSLCISWVSSDATVATVTTETCPLGLFHPELHFRAAAHLTMLPVYAPALR